MTTTQRVAAFVVVRYGSGVQTMDQPQRNVTTSTTASKSADLYRRIYERQKRAARAQSHHAELDREATAAHNALEAAKAAGDASAIADAQARVDAIRPAILEALEDRKWAGYGSTNHGSNLLPWLLNWAASKLIDSGPTIIIDIGCGNGEASRSFREAGIDAVGLDVACPGADVHGEIADAESLLADHIAHIPHANRIVTAFDVLEHIPEDELPQAFAVMRTLAPTFAASISYGPAMMEFEGENLHATQHDEFWWIDQIRSAGGVVYRLPSGYLIGRWQ